MQHPRFFSCLLVTGGAGFIGSAFIRRLLKSDLFSGRIVCLDALTYAAHPESLKEVESNPRYRFVYGNICDAVLLEKLFQEEPFDGIIHFAAETHVDRSIDCAKPFVDTNVMGTLMLLEAARKVPSIHFHHVSTDEVYGSLGPQGVFHETSCIQPNSPYAASKAAADHLVRSFGITYSMSVTTSHCGNNLGPYQFPEKLVPLMISHCLTGKSLPIYGEGKQVRDWIYVEDHVEAIWQIVQFGRAGEVYNIGADQELSNLELVHRLIDVIGKECGLSVEDLQRKICFVKDRPGHDFRYALDSSKLKQELNWTPKHSLEEGLQKTVRFYQAQYALLLERKNLGTEKLDFRQILEISQS